MRLLPTSYLFYIWYWDLLRLPSILPRPAPCVHPALGLPLAQLPLSEGHHLCVMAGLLYAHPKLAGPTVLREPAKEHTAATPPVTCITGWWEWSTARLS